MPVFNEAPTIEQVVQRVRSVPLDHEVILVNDASSDGTHGIVNQLAAPDLKVIHHPINRGKGAAIRTGMKEATGEVIVIQDADLEYDPNDFVRLIQPIQEGKANVVYGVRSLETQRLIMRMGNNFLTWVTNVMYGGKLGDMETCYKMMRREIALSLDLECRRFDVEAEITAKLLRAGHTIHELPISYHARYENKKLSPSDGIPALQALWKYRKWKAGS
ncbi:MAG: glycosyltransferase family 2 protein [Chloroflexi bacterium]|nr:glycosyltransferase family 2 protein [Chloroflexota bacterium]